MMEKDRIVTLEIEITVPMEWDKYGIEDNVQDAIIDYDGKMEVISINCITPIED